MDWKRTAVASVLICAAGGAFFWRATDGFHAFTTEQARRRAVARAPRAVPNVALEDQDGRSFTLAEYRGHPLAVDFVYTQCASICPMLSAGFQRLDRAERARSDGASERLHLVTISFDPRDTPAELREYAARYQADGTTWRLARVSRASALEPLLRAVGIVVIPDGRGNFQHNAAVLVLDAEGRLARVLDADATPDEVARAVSASGVRLLDPEPRSLTLGRAATKPGAR